jgi:hypothetical protein
MIDQRVSRLLKAYYSVRSGETTTIEKILVHKYNNLFHEIKYKYEKIFSLGYENYELEFDNLLEEISEREMVLIAILEELIELAS